MLIWLKCRHLSTSPAVRYSVFRVTRITLAFLVSAALTCSPIFAQRRPPHVRTISHGLGISITDRLLPDDEIVVITREFDTVQFFPEPTAGQVIEDVVGMADIVAIVDTREVRGILVEDGTWIDTRVVGTVRDILSFSKNTRIGRGQQLELQATGGEMMIRKVLVRAGRPSIVSRRRYLMFLAADPVTGVLNPIRTPLLIENNKLVNPLQIQQGSTTRDPLHGLVLNQVTTEIRRLAK